MSEAKKNCPPLYSFDFNHSVKLRNESPRITSNAGALLLREVDHKLGVVDSLANDLFDPRDNRFTRYSMAELLRERLYAFATGHARQDDVDILAHDPAFKTAVWDRAGDVVADERLASQPTASRLIDMLTQGDNRLTLGRHTATPILRHLRQSGNDRKVSLGVIDIDGFPIETHGQQEGAAHNGYYRKTIYSPLVAYFSPEGTFESDRLGEGFLHAMLRDGNAAPADWAELVLDEAVDKAREMAQTVAVRMDAGFASAKVLNHLNAKGVKFTARLPANAALERLAANLVARPAGRPTRDGYEFAIDFHGYRNPDWDEDYRVVLVVVDKPGRDGALSLFPHHFFLVTNWPTQRFQVWDLLSHYRKRGTFEDRLGEWNAFGVNLSHNDFGKNEVTLLLSMLAFNLCAVLRGEMESASDSRTDAPAAPEESGMDMGRFCNLMLKVGATLTRGGRRLCFDIAQGIAPLWCILLKRLGRFLPPPQTPLLTPMQNAFTPLPEHAFRTFTPRL